MTFAPITVIRSTDKAYDRSVTSAQGVIEHCSPVILFTLSCMGAEAGCLCESMQPHTLANNLIALYCLDWIT